MPSSRPSSPRGSSRTRGTSRPGSRPGQRPGAGRSRTAAAARPAPPRARFTGRAAILVLVLAVLMVSYASSMRAYLEQKKQLASLRESISSSEANIAHLEREKRRWKDPAYVEAQARQRFGWVLPGEIGYQVIGTDGKPLGHEDTLTDPATLDQTDHPLWWQAAWGSVKAAGNPEAPKPPPAERISAPKKQKQKQ